MKGIRCKPENRDRLGLMHSDDFPLIFRLDINFENVNNNLIFI